MGIDLSTPINFELLLLSLSLSLVILFYRGVISSKCNKIIL